MRTRAILRPACPVLAWLALSSAPILAQAFDYTDFSSTTGLVLVGDAQQIGNVMNVAPAAGNQMGAFYYDTPVTVAGGFQCTFQFRFPNSSGGGADGLVFVIHNDPRGTMALGEPGTSLGYTEYVANPTGTAIVNSLAVEFDTWLSGGIGDLSGNEISIHTNGVMAQMHEEAFSIGSIDPGIDMSDGFAHTARITLSNGVVDVYLDNLTTPVVSAPYNFSNGGTQLGGAAVGGLNLIGGDKAYVGFTATTGGAWEDHEVLSWNWDYPFIGVSFCGPAINNSTGQPGEIMATGSVAVSADSLGLTASQLPANKFGYFIGGVNQAFIPGPGGSQGNLCIGTPQKRIIPSLANSGAGGTLAWNVDLDNVDSVGQGMIGSDVVQAGQTWNFQCWYRDVNPTTTSNFTNGVAVSFQ